MTERIPSIENFIVAERMSGLETRSGADSWNMVRSGADIRLWEISRILTERISARMDYYGADVDRTVLFPGQIVALRGTHRNNRAIPPRCTVAITLPNVTVIRGNFINICG